MSHERIITRNSNNYRDMSSFIEHIKDIRQRIPLLAIKFDKAGHVRCNGTDGRRKNGTLKQCRRVIPWKRPYAHFCPRHARQEAEYESPFFGLPNELQDRIIDFLAPVERVDFAMAGRKSLAAVKAWAGKIPTPLHLRMENLRYIFYYDCPGNPWVRLWLQRKKVPLTPVMESEVHLNATWLPKEAPAHHCGCNGESRRDSTYVQYHGLASGFPVVDDEELCSEPQLYRQNFDGACIMCHKPLTTKDSQIWSLCHPENITRESCRDSVEEAQKLMRNKTTLVCRGCREWKPVVEWCYACHGRTGPLVAARAYWKLQLTAKASYPMNRRLLKEDKEDNDKGSSDQGYGFRWFVNWINFNHEGVRIYNPSWRQRVRIIWFSSRQRR